MCLVLALRPEPYSPNTCMYQHSCCECPAGSVEPQLQVEPPPGTRTCVPTTAATTTARARANSFSPRLPPPRARSKSASSRGTKT